MPSVHIGWALLIGVCVLCVASNPWRYLGAVHAAATTFAVVATGNHYCADGFVAAVLVAATLAAQALVRRRPGARVEPSGSADATDASGEIEGAVPVDRVTRVNGRSHEVAEAESARLAGEAAAASAPVRPEEK